MKHPIRVVSLIASATEIVCALGQERALVGRSHECDFPASVIDLPPCTAPAFDVHGSSRGINNQVKALLHNALSVYRVHEQVLKDLRPDLIITQTQCEVCAVSLREVEQVVGQWLGSRPRIVSLTPDSLADVWHDIVRVADALQEPQAGADLVHRLQEKMNSITLKAKNLVHQPRVACIEWVDPLMAAGNWMPELVVLAGGSNLFGEAGRHAPGLTWEQLRDQNPDVIMVIPCGFDLSRTKLDMPLLEQKPGWDNLQAVGAGRVYVTDGNQYFNRPGPRMLESLEILAEILHPAEFDFGHQGLGWEPWPRSATK